MAEKLTLSRLAKVRKRVGKRIDERQALLTGKRSEKAAALQLCAEIAAIQVDKPREQGNQRQNPQQPPGQQAARFPNNNLG